MRFGIVRNQTLPWPELLRQWQGFDQLGFDFGWATDHFQRPSDPSGPHMDSWTTLAAVAARTQSIRLGVLVSSNTFRHPSLLAKQAVTIDHISNGRLELGIGAGWFELEHRSFGINYPSNGERVDRLEEAIEVVDRLLRLEISSYSGKFYTLDEAPFRPRPIQLPRPPLTIGAHGPRMLALTARFADRWNSFGSTEEISVRGKQLDEACALVGRDPATIIRSLYYWTRLLGTDPWSSSDAFSEVVGRYQQVGIDEVVFEPPEDHQWNTMEQICADVIPGLRTKRHSDSAAER